MRVLFVVLLLMSTGLVTESLRDRVTTTHAVAVFNTCGLIVTVIEVKGNGVIVNYDSNNQIPDEKLLELSLLPQEQKTTIMVPCASGVIGGQEKNQGIQAENPVQYRQSREAAYR